MLQKRALTVNFQRSVTSKVPVVMEVAINPLSEPNAPHLDASLVGREHRDVLLSNEVTPTVFNLVPTDSPDLTVRVPYRIAWREKYMGKQFVQDFVMPDFDCDFDDLHDLDLLIGGTTYVQWTDVGVPDGVARLDSQGRVVDGEGNPVSGAESASIVQGNLEVEQVARAQGDEFLRRYFLQFASDQITQVYSSTAAQLSAAVTRLDNVDLVEKTGRQAAVTALNATITALTNSTNTQLAALDGSIDSVTAALGMKADLVGGKIPSDQLPQIALGRAITVANQAEMLALTIQQVQPGDFAVRPDGIFFLNDTPASTLANWVRFQVSATVLSVNGQTGAIVLNAANVGARPSNVPVPQADVAGLGASLALKTDATVSAAISARLTVLESDATIVRTASGTIPKALITPSVAFINADGQITRKDGTVLNLGGGGGDLDIADVTGLVAALAGKLSATDPSVTNARTPLSHAASHRPGGGDDLSLGMGDITGLTSTLEAKANAATVVAYGNRIGSLETRVDDLETSGTPGGGGGGGTSAKATSWQAPAPTTDFSTVLVKSPFGLNGSGYYYDPAGAADGQAVWPYLTPNGHLKFIKRNESAPIDEPLATASALALLAAVVDLKASQSALNTANAAIDTKASLAALSTLQANVETRATVVQLNSLNDALSLKASQSAVDALSAAVALKASQSSLDGLSAALSTKAEQSALDAVSGLVAALQTGKADLTSGLVPQSQLPETPQSKVTGLVTALTGKADLSGGRVMLAQIPDLPTSKIPGLDATLANKADLVGGRVPTSQLPSLATSETYVVANRPAMLALTTTQVQRGDVAVISATADKGTYILNADDPTVYTNWVKLTTPDDVVTSVNGQNGIIVLDAASVGARSSATPIGQGEVTGLSSALASKADQNSVTTGLAGKTAISDVLDLIFRSASNKQRADYASTVPIASLSGSQSVDGTLVPTGAVVLLTAQSSSVANGLYVVGSGAWTRTADAPNGDYYLRGAQVVVLNGSNNANSIWLQTNTSGVIGTAANNWTKVLTAGAQPTYTASLGVQKVGNDFRGQAVAGGGIQYVSGGAQLDPNVAVRKYAADVPSGSAVVTINHNLNNLDVGAFFRDKASGDAVLLGWKPTGVNTISAEFKDPPAAGQWRCVVLG